MMLPTHALAGLAVAAPLLVLAPEHAEVALAGALAGSILPDVDMYAGHRRSLHFPTGYTAIAVPVSGFATLVPTTATVGLAFLLVGAALHCRMDRYGGGLELRPWEARSDRAVYDHVKGRWRRPKRWISYDGAPADLGVTLVLGVPLAVVLSGPFRLAVGAALAVGVVYVLLRRRLAALAPVVVEAAPDALTCRVPDRYRQGDARAR